MPTPSSKASRPTTESRLFLATGGGVTVEYIVVLVLVSLGLAGAAVSLGPPLLASYRVQQALLLLPLPP